MAARDRRPLAPAPIAPGEVGGATADALVPPARSRGVLPDVRHFLLHKPTIATLISFTSDADRENYSQRIIQRLGKTVAQYEVLNIHKIGIQAPVRFVFEELLRWDGDSTCWPNHVARFDRIDGRLEHIRVLLFGQSRYPLGLTSGPFGLDWIPLFNLNAEKIQDVPDRFFDNARYLLYESSGGYPVGFFAVYVRSAIADQLEVEPAQLFAVVGFNFYGRDRLPSFRIVNAIWEAIHNRVTANVLNRLKQLCEWRFQRFQAGERLRQEVAKESDVQVGPHRQRE